MANQRDPLQGIAYVKRCERDGEKAPFMEGFIGVTKELLEVLLAQDTDDYGCVKIDISLWKQDTPGVLKGTAKLPWSVRKQMSEGAPAASPKKPPVAKNIKSYSPETDEDQDF